MREHLQVGLGIYRTLLLLSPPMPRDMTDVHGCSVAMDLEGICTAHVVFSGFMFRPRVQGSGFRLLGSGPRIQLKLQSLSPHVLIRGKVQSPQTLSLCSCRPYTLEHGQNQSAKETDNEMEAGGL